MGLTRRGWIGASAWAAGACLAEAARAQSAPPPSIFAPAPTPSPAGSFLIRAPGGGHDYTAALAALRDYARQELAAYGLPGMTLSVTDEEGFTAVLALGWADTERRMPVGPAHYFQIGSISKSFIALTVLALADQGRIDLDAPLSRYLPDVPLPPGPITPAQLLSHSTGLADGAAFFPRVPDGRLWSGFPPGSHFSYSNTGFGLLGKLIERVTGETHQGAVKRLVRDKLGLSDMAGTISQAGRGRFAVGYWPWDRSAAAVLPGARLEFASWDEEDNPAGSLGGTSEQLAAYLRVLLRLGRGEGAPVLSDAAARRFATPVIDTDEFGPGARYACGVAVVPVDGTPCLHHTGGMMAFSSSFHADPAAGVACFASVNARNEGYRPRLTTAYAVRLMRAARTGAPLPAPPDPLGPYRLKDAARHVGAFAAADGRSFTLTETPEGLAFKAAAVARALPQGPGRLITDDPAYSRHGLDAVVENGKVAGFWWGETLFGRDGPRPTPPPAERLRPLAGDYLNRDPWIGGASVLVRGDALVVEGLGPIIDRGPWWSAEKDPGGVERLRFDALLNGRAQRLNVSGDDLLRLMV
jgi:CubicO group peptidase (beta-lactamase class C family)